MLIRVDPQSGEPIFEQIAFQVKGAVARGELAAGDRLPSVRQLAKELTVNPNTVVRSYELLERDGVIVRRHGAGCFISEGTSSLSTKARRKELDQLMERAVTEAFHLGFDADALEDALERALRNLQLTNGRKKS